MSEIKRTEILFLYDVQNANPNGDPSDENKPRIDEETGINIVTDVRLKRTVRDYLFNYKGYNVDGVKDIFVRQTFVDNNPEKGLNDGKNRGNNYKSDLNLILNACIDIRLFGGVIPLEKSSITFTGPVQFKMGHSLHKVTMQYIKGTGAFAAKPGAKQQTFREEYILPYSMIAFYGIINENAAKQTHLMKADIEELKDALWNGTKQLITRSKMEHNPRLLLMLEHQDSNFFIGELDRYIKLNASVPDQQIRSIKDFTLDMSAIKAVIEARADKKPVIFMQKDPNLVLAGW
ncbi:MAG: type I-B CRISPR-associated protein Cas7/Csh2 [Candidatus Cloacimonas sp.]|jgi:CRISPR-associated protein Csh2|nr:type I-B CRISPR-associated protein Cas7/Csh2 [Candidatus Cloacimonas sp.]